MVKKLNKNNKSKKAQMKIQQMSFMLIAVFIFFALVGMIVLTFFLNNMETKAEELREQNALLLASKIANSPELSCGGAYSEEKTDCIDLDKVIVLKEDIEKYKRFWGVSSLEIRKLYPKISQENNDVECTMENYPNCNLITLINNPSTPDRSNYVALCRKDVYKGEIVDICEIGIIIVGYEGIK